MEKSWLDVWQEESSTESKTKPTANPNISSPLQEALKQLVRRESFKLNADATDLISRIEEVAQAGAENMYAALVDALKPCLGDGAATLVRKVMSFKRKKCRDWPNCTRGELCIFLHSGKRKMADEKSTKRKRVEFNEIILNKVKNDDERLVREFCEKYGSIRGIKNLKEGKWLVKFEKHEEARGLIEDKTPVFGDASITKFYNRFAPRTTHDDLITLFEQHNEIVAELSKLTKNQTLLSKLRWINNRIRSVVLPDKRRKPAAKSGNVDVNVDYLMEICD